MKIPRTVWLSLLTFFVATSCAQAEFICQGPCVEVTPTTVPATPSPTSTPSPTRTPLPTSTPIPPTRTPTPVATATPTVRVVNFIESQAIFGNPGIGFETTQRPLTDFENPRGVPSTSMEFGQYIDEGYANIDAMILRARAAGQTILLRIAMCDPDYGTWLKGVLPGFTFHVGSKPNRFCADLDNEQVLQRVEQAIAGYGARYNSNPTIEHVDIRIVGLWGEWHYSATVPQVPMPSEATSVRIINAYRNAFPSKKLIAVLDGDFARKHAADVFSGLRMDCWGGNANHEGPGKLYERWYNGVIDNTPPMHEVWRRGVVVLEPCGPMDSENVTQKVDLAIARHASLINMKGLPTFTDAQWIQWQRLLKKLGYRFTVKQVRMGDGVGLTFENVGIAPNYTPLDVSIEGVAESVHIPLIMPGGAVDIVFRTATLPTKIHFSMGGKVVRTANDEWSDGIAIQ